MAERPRWEYRNRDERRDGLEQRQRIGGERHLRHVEFLVAQHPEECLLDRKMQADEIDAISADALVGERSDAVVVPAGERQSQLRHGGSTDATAEDAEDTEALSWEPSGFFLRSSASSVVRRHQSTHDYRLPRVL